MAANQTKQVMKSWFMSGSPNTGSGSTLHVILKLARPRTKGTLHTVGCLLVASVQHRSEQIEHEFDDIVRHVRLDQRVSIRLRRNCQVSNVAPGSDSYFFDCFCKGEQPLSGKLIELSGMAIVGQRSD